MDIASCDKLSSHYVLKRGVTNIKRVPISVYEIDVFCLEMSSSREVFMVDMLPKQLPCRLCGELVAISEKYRRAKTAICGACLKDVAKKDHETC